MTTDEKIVLITTKENLQDLFLSITLDILKDLNTNEWVSKEVAAQMLGISTYTLGRWRVEGKIDFSQPSDGIFLYSRSFINNYIKSKSTKAFKK